MLVCGNSLLLSLHTPFLSNQAKPMKWQVGVAGHQRAAGARGGSLSCISKQGLQRKAFIASLPLLKLFQDKREQHT